MNRSRQTEILGGILTIIILIALIFLSNIEVNRLSYLENVSIAIISPVQKMFTIISNKINRNESYFTSMNEILEENRELKERNSELETALRELEIIKAENKQLQQYMNLTEKYNSYNTIPAHVINRDISNYSSTLILNVGTDDGIKEKMTVIADKGLVGHIISASKNTCKVQVIIDAASAVGSTISTTNENIICKGTLDNNQLLRAYFIPTGADLIKGDTVYTSDVGGIYPKGIIIGTIKEMVTTRNITDRYAIVEPMIDFSKIDTVLIITD